MQEGKPMHTSFPPRWDDAIWDELVLVQDIKLACTSFLPRWDDVVLDELMLM